MADSSNLSVTTSKAFATFERMIALRYMIPNKKQIFTSIISIISLVGITLGVFALVVVMSVMGGFRADLLDRILGMNGHLTVYSGMDSDFSDYKTLIPKLDTVEGVKYVLPIVRGQALVQGPSGDSSGAYVRGLRAQDIAKIEIIVKNIKSGSLAEFDKTDGVVIGQDMAEKLGLFVGDDIRIISPDGDTTPFGVNPRVKAYKVLAIFQIGAVDFDSGLIFMPLKETEAFFNLDDRINALEVFSNNPDEIDKIKPLLEKAAGRQLAMSDWRQNYSALFNALQVERVTMFIILSLIILVAALNIISGLIMLVKDKTHDIAILRTMGATRWAVLRIFIMAGMAIGVIGTVVGAILGIIFCFNINAVQEFLSWILGVDLYNAQTYLVAKLPSRVDPIQVFLIVSLSLSLSFIATIIPAWLAARLDPVKALRYE